MSDLTQTLFKAAIAGDYKPASDYDRGLVDGYQRAMDEQLWATVHVKAYKEKFKAGFKPVPLTFWQRLYKSITRK
jgi:hypothetical protein